MWKNVPVTFTTHGGNLSTIDARLGACARRSLLASPAHRAQQHLAHVRFVRSRLHLPVALFAVAKIVMGDRQLLDRVDSATICSNRPRAGGVHAAGECDEGVPE